MTTEKEEVLASEDKHALANVGKVVLAGAVTMLLLILVAIFIT